MNTKEINIFSPGIVILLVLIYLIASIVGFSYNIKGLTGVNNKTIIVILFGLIAYSIGILIAKQTNKKYKIKKSNLIERITSKNIILSLVIIGIILQIINFIYLGGIPLFSGYLKAKAATRIWLLSYLIFLPSINILLAKYFNKKQYILLIFGLILFSLTGYRTTAIAILISALITIYYTQKIPWKYILLSILGIIIILLGIGYIATQFIEWQTWTLNPIELLFYRAGYTLQVLNNAIMLEAQTNGQLLYNTLTGFLKSTDPRAIVGQVTLGYFHSTTSTIFGPAILDFGIPVMLIQMMVLGFILETISSIQLKEKGLFTALYAILTAHTIIWIETGPTDLVIFLFFLITIIITIFSIKTKEG
ncbi:MAG: oligosaccharide repeat unit polymerase family protein [Methanobacteriaceae archaeon]|nr:oligosaccharide repeat unit polymerase family protein [Methanobacteriaceae archaeon]